MTDVVRKSPTNSGKSSKLPIHLSKTTDSKIGEGKRITQAPSSNIPIGKRERAEKSPDPPKSKKAKVHELKIKDNGQIVEIPSEVREQEGEENEIEENGFCSDDFWGEEGSEPDWDGESGYDDEEEETRYDDQEEEAEFDEARSWYLG